MNLASHMPCSPCWTATLALILLVAAAAISQTASAGSADLLAKARAAEQQQNFAAAARLYRDYLMTHPPQPDLLQRLGLVYYLSHRFDQAIPPFTQALKLDPSLWGSALFLGISYYRTGRFNDALASLHRALSLKPGLAEAEFWLGSTLLANNQPEDAISHLRQAQGDTRLALDADSLLIKAFQQAASDYDQQIVRFAPHSARVHQLKAEALARDSNPSGALLEYQRALQVDPHLEGAHRAIGKLYWHARQFDLAAREFADELRMAPPDSESSLRLGEYWQMKGKPAEAIHYLKAALDAHTPHQAEAYHFLGLAQLARKNFDEAESAFKLAEEKNPNEASNYQLLAKVYEQMGKTTRAERQRQLFREHSAGVHKFDQGRNP